MIWSIDHESSGALDAADDKPHCGLGHMVFNLITVAGCIWIPAPILVPVETASASTNKL